MSEDGVTVTSTDGEAEDGALRALREEQAKLDQAWNKRKRVFKKHPFLECLTTRKIELEPRISPAEPRSVTSVGTCAKDAIGTPEGSTLVGGSTTCCAVSRLRTPRETRAPPALEK